MKDVKRVKKLMLLLIFRTDFTHDIWQFGIVIFICLTGERLFSATQIIQVGIFRSEM